MARKEIIEKLDKALNEDIINECQVVYILSRIRKILELENKKKDYKFLNVYCNWILHTYIDKTKSIEKELVNFIKGDDKGFLNFDFLKEDLRNFLCSNNLNTKIIDNAINYYSFVNRFLEIVSDSPMSLILPEVTHKIIIKKPRFPFPNCGFTVEFYVDSEFKFNRVINE